MTRIYLARHGETKWNATHRIQGWTNSDLNDKGVAQAAALAERLKSIPLTAIYSSDLTRALDTTAPIAALHHLEVQPVSNFREKGFGAWEGLTADDLAQDYPDEWHRYHALREWDAPVPGGETWADVQARMVAALNEILAAHSGLDESVLLVGHGGSLRIAIVEALRAPLPTLPHLHLSNASLSRLDFDAERRGRVMFLNDTSHVEHLRHD